MLCRLGFLGFTLYHVKPLLTFQNLPSNLATFNLISSNLLVNASFLGQLTLNPSPFGFVFSTGSALQTFVGNLLAYRQRLEGYELFK